MVNADKCYDANNILLVIETAGSKEEVPPKSNRVVLSNDVERFFQKIKNLRRIATRYKRLAVTSSAMLYLDLV